MSTTIDISSVLVLFLGLSKVLLRMRLICLIGIGYESSFGWTEWMGDKLGKNNIEEMKGVCKNHGRRMESNVSR